MGSDEADGLDLDRLVSLLADAEDTVALTGAGVSTASGIPDFRGPEGIWNREFNPADFHRQRFDADPAGFWEDRLALQEAMIPDDVAPNAAHHALADLESAGHLSAVITQNTDGLHVAGGSASVIQLHGDASRVVCERCDSRGPAGPVFERVDRGDRPPTCEACGGLLKPDVVLFGESIPADRLERARSAVADATALLAIGTSLVVEPAASLPARALEAGGALGIVNLEPTPYDDRADVVVRGDVTTVLPAAVERLG